MASSMIRPTAIVKPASVRMLSEKPPIAVPSSATRTLVGKDTAVTRVARMLRRKRKIAKIANSAPRRPSRRRSLSDARIPVALSSMSDSRSPGSRCSAATLEWMSFDRLMALPFGSRIT